MKHFTLWALKSKLETHETIFATTSGKDTDENKASLACRKPYLCSDSKHLGWRWVGWFTCGYPVEEVCSFSQKRIDLETKNGLSWGGWLGTKGTNCSHSWHIHSSGSASIIWSRSVFLWIHFFQYWVLAMVSSRESILLPSALLPPVSSSPKHSK